MGFLGLLERIAAWGNWYLISPIRSQEKAQTESATKEATLSCAQSQCKEEILCRNVNKIDFVHRHDMLKMVRTATCDKQNVF